MSHATQKISNCACRISDRGMFERTIYGAECYNVSLDKDRGVFFGTNFLIHKHESYIWAVARMIQLRLLTKSIIILDTLLRSAFKSYFIYSLQKA